MIRTRTDWSALHKRSDQIWFKGGAEMRTIVKIIDAINEWVGRLISLLMIPLVVIAAYEVVMRYVFKKPTIWAWDLNIQIFAAIVMLGGGYTLLTDGHVKVDVITAKCSEKTKYILDLLAPIFILISAGVLIVYGWDLAWMSFGIRETVASVWAPPYYYMKAFVPVGALLLFLQGLSETIKCITKAPGNSTGK
jgi:TRAP-type mannitol/chloroaromatic compound transport system permease small subunit